jgi:penicillin-binding protein 1C
LRALTAVFIAFMLNLHISYRAAFFILFITWCFWFWFSLPEPLFNTDYATIIESAEGELLGGVIAKDEQWRFPPGIELPEKYITCVLLFEDEHFYKHLGINPLALGRALIQNIKAGRIVSGGSTISMQVMRLSGGNTRRNFFRKLVELQQALRLEIKFSKREILSLYAAHAPFGGNVVGIEAAAWRYFGRSVKHLSWAECATLAILPNAPGLIHPGRNQNLLKAKRNRLLAKLYSKGIIDKTTYELSIDEELPSKTFKIPMLTPHLLQRAVADGNRGKKIRSTIKLKYQQYAQQIVDIAHRQLTENAVQNLAMLVLDIKKQEVLAYIGNTNCGNAHCGQDVDIITAPRSTGSLLKPFLYAAMLEDGVLLPNMLVSDVPSRFGKYLPQNFDKTYDGMVPASDALARSLNVPAVRMLNEYGIDIFFHKLKKLDLNTINKPARYYGLSLMLGGAESTLWDLCNEYMRLANSVKMGYKHQKARFILGSQLDTIGESYTWQPGAAWHTLEALSSLNRPGIESSWDVFASARKVAWKTGTSFGHRDAWAIGATPDFVVGVWAGNASGEGRPGLTGLQTAAPIMFKMFKFLGGNSWFSKPISHLIPENICQKSGFRAGEHCNEIQQEWIPPAGISSPLCPYHQQIFTDSSGQFRVNSNCASVYNMKTVSWFVLPLVEEWYYKMRNSNYRSLPPFAPDCNTAQVKNMAISRPKPPVTIFIPRELNSVKSKTIFELVHRQKGVKVFWHLDGEYIGETLVSHKQEIDVAAGQHIFTITDEFGEELIWPFEVVQR